MSVSPPGPRYRIAWLLAGIALLVLLVIVLRQPLADRLWPEARAQRLREAAALALANQKLTAPDGSGARELYEAALALDPDRDEARVGLQRVAQAALAQARQAMQAQRFDTAHRALQLARDLAVPRAQADAVAETLRQREAEVAGIDGLLARAAAARKAGRLDGDDTAALPLYRRVLALQPNRTEALEGREDALSELLQRATALIGRHQLADAAALVERARGYDPGHVNLPDLHAQLARAADARRVQGQRLLRRGRLDAAAVAYRDALAVAPDDADAQAGLEQVAVAHAQRAERLAADFRFADAERALRQARRLAPQSPALGQAERRIAQSRQHQRQLHVPVDSAQRARHVRRLLAAAAAAESRGDLLAPPGESAYDHLRAARALAPNDASVRRASARLLPTAKKCFEDELRGNRLVRAQACLDARLQLEGETASARDARRRLASRWIAVGDERLGAGELDVARRALAAAHALDPRTPGLDALAERLRAATPVRD